MGRGRWGGVSLEWWRVGSKSELGPERALWKGKSRDCPGIYLTYVPYVNEVRWIHKVRYGIGTQVGSDVQEVCLVESVGRGGGEEFLWSLV